MEIWWLRLCSKRGFWLGTKRQRVERWCKLMKAVDRVKESVGPELFKKLQFNSGDLRNTDNLDNLFSKTKYCQLNIYCTINLYEIMAKYNCKKMVFSPSATVYGQPKKIPCVEDFELKVMNPYGWIKVRTSLS
ncbi:hypothetical protein PVK06_024165 [Gossypium arboreum]|uniref:UDP-glucose 4-epimerase n=1 Tax=Gossypium arboreum TaxID=29729 RepID=A0ABR0PDA7_GOSAR|nr:hypothetical protein PVK06_024165 [Gossypium arboreum]